MENWKAMYEKWLESDRVSESVKNELRALGEEDIKIRFSNYMSFGTAGLRAEMGAGTAFMNTYTVAHATMGIARLICDMGEDAKKRGVVIAYDSRNNSPEFAKRCAEVLSAEGIQVYLFESLRPTPVLSFSIRELGCAAGINITASHNPKKYNGYKAYFEDGAQLSPDNAETVSKAIMSIDIFDGVPTPEEARAELIKTVGRELDEKYMEKVLAQRVNENAIRDAADGLKIVYSPLHGAGAVMVPEVLRRAGLKNLYTVDSQMAPDGNFPTVEYPNPEFPAAFEEGIKIAEKVGCDLIVATDPDADRVGVAARDKNGKFNCITGNQMGALLLDYIITANKESGKLPEDAYAVKTIVTSEMASEICSANGVKMYNVLTGFKFIGEVIKNSEESGKGTFLLGFEESYGYLKGTYARDKDAVVASLLICEMAAFYKLKNMTLSDALEALFEKYGYFKESVKNVIMDTPDGSERMANVMKALRKNPPTSLGGKKIVEFRDYSTGVVKNLATGETSSTNLPLSDVLYYVNEEGDVIVVRPSGTEPKVKIYVLTRGSSAKAAEDSAKASLDDIGAMIK